MKGLIRWTFSAGYRLGMLLGVLPVIASRMETDLLLQGSSLCQGGFLLPADGNTCCDDSQHRKGMLAKQAAEFILFCFRKEMAEW